MYAIKGATFIAVITSVAAVSVVVPSVVMATVAAPEK
jgi:hypothetical protein